MSEVTHHISEPLLMAYSAGTLPEAFNLVVATHLSLCDESRARAESFDAIGGAVLEQTEAVSMSEGSLAATLALIAGPQEDAIRVDVPAESVFPAPLRDYVGGDVDTVRWRSVGGGVKQAILPSSKDATARLLYIPGGAAVPDHGHRGTELTLVLQGAFRDDYERFGRGDLEIATAADVHTPVAEEGTACICLAATDAPLRFKGWLPRIAQPFLRI